MRTFKARLILPKVKISATPELKANSKIVPLYAVQDQAFPY